MQTDWLLLIERAVIEANSSCADAALYCNELYLAGLTAAGNITYRNEYCNDIQRFLFFSGGEESGFLLAASEFDKYYVEWRKATEVIKVIATTEWKRLLKLCRIKRNSWSKLRKEKKK